MRRIAGQHGDAALKHTLLLEALFFPARLEQQLLENHLK